MIDSRRLQSLHQSLLARAQQRSPDDWLPLAMAGADVGVTSPEVASFLASSCDGFILADYRLLLDDEGLDADGRSRLLAAAAARLHDGGLLRGWRNELLDVRPAPEAAPIAVIERAACRALGITTRAVHLNALTPDGKLIVARRAAHKQIDPGLWDNLVGGMVPAGESDLDALAREAREEAGLDLDRLAVGRAGRVRVTRVVPEGFQSEIVQVFNATVPTGTPLANQDGEVAAIETHPLATVLQMIEADDFTLEAALVTLAGIAER